MEEKVLSENQEIDGLGDVETTTGFPCAAALELWLWKEEPKKKSDLCFGQSHVRTFFLLLST